MFEQYGNNELYNNQKIKFDISSVEENDASQE
jgi:hypothetical protein